MNEGVERENIFSFQEQQQTSHKHIISLSNMTAFEKCNGENDFTPVHLGQANSRLKTNIIPTGDSAYLKLFRFCTLYDFY